ncbi:RNA polymerase factor sigma-54 [Paenibacillus albiflavus]|uniref:RNA polymerase factor sigma-54 n=1 Tax=Paenibacillus albiflavus TaxID=2545760 RepID=UPI0014042AD2|nr:RNA polymerase factor sigma-54 [Paenibacillus albiflavus]
MKLENNLSQTLNTSLTITPRFVQAIHILQMPSVDLTEYLQEQCAENPLIEVVYDSDLELRRKKVSYQLEEYDETDWMHGYEETLEDMLISQLRVLGLTGSRYRAAAYLAGNLNEHGYLSVGLEEASIHLDQPIEVVKQALLDIQSLEPAGIGARDLQECLLIQLNRMDGINSSAYAIISSFIHELASSKFKRIADSLQITVDEVKQVLGLIRQLNPRPGLAYNHSIPKYVVPDAFIERSVNGYTVILNERSYPQINVRPYHKDLAYLKQDKEARTFLREYAYSAKWLARSLEQRRTTLLRVIESIVEEQHAFLDNGIHSLKPMNMKAISNRLQLHESTISRAIAHKYVQTPRGLFELKSFFTNGLVTNDGAVTSSESIKALIRKLIANEDQSKPYSDQQITDILVKEGMQISRRTVMKYREELHIVSSRLRATGRPD